MSRASVVTVLFALVLILFAVVTTEAGGGGAVVGVAPEVGAAIEPGVVATTVVGGPGPGPGDGTASKALPVVVEPATGLVDGQVVAISGSGFPPDTRLGAVLCSAGSAGGGGVRFCELAHFDNFTTNPDGTFADDYVVRRFIETPAEGQVDCATASGGCILSVGSISDYDESGGAAITFEVDPAPAP